VKRIRFRSALGTGVFVAVLVASWWYFAPTRVGGSTTYVATHGVSMKPRFHTGDLALVRPVGEYKVGDVVAYHSSVLQIVVLHRIVAIRSGHYTFKGDNNNFLDPAHPARADLIGRLWVRVPHGGVVLHALHNPVVDAVGCGLLGMFVLTGVGQSRRRRRRERKGAPGPGRVGPTIMKREREADPARTINFGPLLAGSTVALTLFLVIAIVAFVSPAHKASSLKTPYTERVQFAYSAHTRRGPVYPDGRIKTGDPIFLSLVRGVDLHIDSSLTSAGPTSVSGAERVVLKLSGPGGWHRTFVVVPQTHFTGAHAVTDVTLNLPQLRGLQAKIGKLTGSESFAGFSMAIGPQVQFAGTLGGRPLSATFKPTLTFQFAGGELQVSGGQGTGSGSFGTPQASYTQAQNGTVSTPSTAPNTLTVVGHSVRIDVLRLIALIGLLFSLGATVFFYLRKRSEPFEETYRIQAQYGHMIVPIVGGDDLGWPPVDVPNIKALVRLAESGQRLILHNRSNEVDTYMVNEEGTVYRYQVKPSKVVWGEWSQPTAPLEEAA
jgi:signal peptidase I